MFRDANVNNVAPFGGKRYGQYSHMVALFLLGPVEYYQNSGDFCRKKERLLALEVEIILKKEYGQVELGGLK